MDDFLNIPWTYIGDSERCRWAAYAFAICGESYVDPFGNWSAGDWGYNACYDQYDSNPQGVIERDTNPVPEPSSLMILAGGVLGLLGILQKRR
jgi:hypothetical protein